MTLVITANTATTDTTTNPEENAPMIDTNTTDTATTEIAPIVEETNTNTLRLTASHSAPEALVTLANKEGSATSALLASIKAVINGESATIAKDCVLTHQDGAYMITLADYDMKKALAPIDTDTELDIAFEKVASSKLTQGKRYMQNLAVTASMLRALRAVHSLRSVCVAIDSKRCDDVDLIITYTESVESIAFKVASLVAPDCSHTRLAVYNALASLASAHVIDTELDLPAIPKSYLPKKLITSPVASAL